jgi:two-component system, NtrC family, sensor kinase
MKRRSRAGGEPSKARRGKAVAVKRRIATKSARGRSSSVADHETEAARLTRELNEALEQQTATSEVLRVISASSGELEPIFQIILKNAARLCEAKFGNLYLYQGGALHTVASHNVPPAFVEARWSGPWHPRPNTAAARVINTKLTVHVPDLVETSFYRERVPEAVAAVELGGVRTTVLVPMLKENELVGIIAIFRQEVRPYTDKQITLLKNFAAQAVIAIENTRLLKELRQRTNDLTESLEQQTATSEVLKVISSSPGDLEPVFQAMLENATRICEANFGVLNLHENGTFRAGATHNVPAPFAEFLHDHRNGYQPMPGSLLDRVMQTKKVSHSADNAAETTSRAATLGGARSTVCVPMLKDDVLVGTFTIYRQEVRPFTDKQIALLQNFAAQAVIAIENARLLSELRDSLEQQTATSDVLRVIASSAGDLQPVFQNLLGNATRLCVADLGFMFQYDGEAFHLMAQRGADQAYVDYMQRAPLRPGPDTLLGRIAKSKAPAHIDDFANSRAYRDRDPLAVVAVESGGVRTLFGVPMLRENELIGAIALFRQEVRPFTDKQIELFKRFADQAVIAVENARLLSELRQRTDDLTETLEQQTATSEVLQVISSSLTDTQPVFDAIVHSGLKLFPDAAIAIALPYGDQVRAAAIAERDPGRVDAWKGRFPNPLSREHMHGTAILDRRIVDVPDAEAHTAGPFVTGVKNFLASGYRAITIMPMIRGDAAIGAMSVARLTPGPLSATQIELLRTFADQAVIAIENVRLFEEVKARTAELSESLEDLRTAQDRLVQTEKLASLGQLTAGIAHEIKNPLNFVNNFSSVSVELIDELHEVLVGVKADDKSRAEMTDLMDTLRGNLDKVVQHGQRADSIVKNMLLHSRQGSGEHRPVDINTLVEESLNLAYHGARAEKQGFNITLEKSFDPDAGEVDLFPQEITRVLLNLISNGFYAATKRKAQTDGSGFEPTLAAATKNLGDRVEIRIRDNGTGIPPEVKDKMFNPFFTTKPAGEGTGLGLSISHDIIVKQHSGSIVVDTEPGKFTEFKIVLPRAGASLNKSGEHA